MHPDIEPPRTPPARDLTLQTVLVLGAAVALLVLVALAIVAWVEHSA